MTRRNERTRPLRNRMDTDRRSMTRRRHIYIRLARKWLEADRQRIDELVERMRVLGLYAKASADKDCRFSVVRTLARIDGADTCDRWHDWADRTNWWPWIHKRRRRVCVA